MERYYTSQKEIKQLYNQLKNSAKKRGIEFNLSLTDLDEIGIPITCPVLGFPIYFYRGKPRPDSISFDRINSSKGYTKDNLIIVSHRVNQLKSNASLEEMKAIADFYDNIKDQQ